MPMDIERYICRRRRRTSQPRAPCTGRHQRLRSCSTSRPTPIGRRRKRAAGPLTACNAPWRPTSRERCASSSCASLRDRRRGRGAGLRCGVGCGARSALGHPSRLQWRCARPQIRRARVGAMLPAPRFGEGKRRAPAAVRQGRAAWGQHMALPPVLERGWMPRVRGLGACRFRPPYSSNPPSLHAWDPKVDFGRTRRCRARSRPFRGDLGRASTPCGTLEIPEWRRPSLAEPDSTSARGSRKLVGTTRLELDSHEAKNSYCLKASELWSKPT